MRVNVQTPNFAADHKLIVDFIKKKLTKLEQFYDRDNVFADVFSQSSKNE